MNALIAKFLFSGLDVMVNNITIKRLLNLKITKKLKDNILIMVKENAIAKIKFLYHTVLFVKKLIKWMGKSNQKLVIFYFNYCFLILIFFLNKKL